MTDDAMFTFRRVGVVRSPFNEKAEAPRQPADAAGFIELFDETGIRDALSDLEAFTHLWMLFVFDRDVGFRPKITPPRSTEKRGVFGTRSPHRPNPIGLSLLTLERIEGLSIHVTGLDVLDGTPVLDIKPYVPYADTPKTPAGSGWLDPTLDPRGGRVVVFDELARAQCSFVLEKTGLDLAARASAALALGTAPHAYRRIKRDGDVLVLAVKAWRVRFHQTPDGARVEAIQSGFRPDQLAGVAPSRLSGGAAELETHRAFAARFGGTP